MAANPDLIPVIILFLMARKVHLQCIPSQNIDLKVYEKTEIEVRSAGGFNSDLTCSWTVSSKRPEAHILIQIKDTWLGNDDKINVYDGLDKDTRSILLSDFTGRGINSQLQDARTGKSLIEFKAGKKKQKGERGFVMVFLAVTSKPTTACKDKTLKAITTGKYLTSPGFPDGYPPNITCSWKIQVPSTKYKLQLELVFVDIESGNTGCEYDYLKAAEVVNGNETKELFTNCNSDSWKRTSYMGSDKEVSLKFFSDDSETRAGFLLRYTAVVKKTWKEKDVKKRKNSKTVAVQEKPKKKFAVRGSKDASTITEIPKGPTAARRPVRPTTNVQLQPPSAPLSAVQFPPCGDCCAFSGVDCIQDCAMCTSSPWELYFAHPDFSNFMNNFNLNLGF